jgi:dihydroflavonol-4-reductase
MILVTGGTGFLGQQIVHQLLNAGQKVRLLVRQPKMAPFPPHPNLEIVEGDVLDVVSVADAMEGVKYVIHAAAVVSFWKKRAAEMKAINVDGTANVVDMAREAGIKKLVHISSIAALGRTKSPAEIDETAKWKDSKLNSNYSRSKFLAEMEVIRGVEEGLPAVMLNPGIIMGAGNWNSGTPHIVKTIFNGLKWYPRGFTGFVGVDDVARAAIALMDSKFVEAERFICVSENLYYKDVFKMIAESVGVKPPSKNASPGLARLGAFLMGIKSKLDGKEPMITPETVRTSGCHFTYDGSKLVREIGFQYTPVSNVIRETGTQFLKENGTQGKR